jgi:hypothetical protein
VLQVRVPKDVPDPVVAVQPVGQAGKWVEWNISQNLTDRFGDVNPHNAANKPLELLEDNEALFEALLSQMWDECTFIVRKDGNFGILFEVEYASRESEGEDDNPDFLAKLKSHDEVVDELLAAMVPLTEQFPGVLFAVPDRKVIINDRPAAWAFVPNGLLNDEQRKELGMALLSL